MAREKERARERERESKRKKHIDNKQNKLELISWLSCCIFNNKSVTNEITTTTTCDHNHNADNK